MNTAQEHPKHEQLIAFMAGQLADSERASLEEHIESCESCCSALRAIPDDAFVARIRAAGAGADFDAGPGLLPRRDQPLPKELREHPRYKIGRFLGAGGMGSVYQAEHRIMDRVVALKIIHRELIRNARVVDRFRQEAKAAARLTHPNIVTAYDAEQAGDVHFLVMEYVDGISLAQFVAKKGPLDVNMVINFARQALKGLQHAFEAGMTHRDIKPHNLMLTRKGQIKILDFGMARLATESQAELALPAGEDRPGLTMLGDIMGTPDFMAPEQIADPSQADIRSDLYGLGCTIFYLLTGQSPFEKKSVRTLRLTGRYRAPRAITDLRSDVPAALVAIIDRMLARAPEDRFQTPADVLKALAGINKSAPTPPPITSKAQAAPVEPSPLVPGFPTQCPFCSTQMRVPAKALGGSVSCSKCSSFFTVAPIEEGKRKA